MVVGFMFSPDKKHVVLIDKQRPTWQKGKLNGIGGHVKSNEKRLYSMVREFKEETGIINTNWQYFAKGYNIDDSDINVWFYKVFSDDYKNVKTITDEAVVIIRIEDLYSLPLIYNLNWLIPLALDNQTKEVHMYFTLNKEKQP